MNNSVKLVKVLGGGSITLAVFTHDSHEGINPAITTFEVSSEGTKICSNSGQNLSDKTDGVKCCTPGYRKQGGFPEHALQTTVGHNARR